MKLKQIQDLFVREGIKEDPRGINEVDLDLLKRKQDYDALSKEKKEKFDIESLENPYYDSRILNGDKETEVKTVMVGIDIETPEILLAKQLINSGKKIDLVIAHHPEGYAYATFHNVLAMQSDILNKMGIPINISEKLLSPRIKEVHRSVMPQNNERVFDAAKLLDVNLMTAHTVADNHVASFLQREIDALSPRYLKDITAFLNKQPEYKHSADVAIPPVILLGSDDSRCGKVFVDMTGGTEGPVEVFEKLSAAGIGTLICMHLSKNAVKEAEKYNLNVVLAGHIASDNLGLNLLLDKLEKAHGKLDFIEASGFRRFRRTAE
ncbi:MAG: NGG1p interacting factor NIF3 [Endomicrobia bacterium]|nr:NGG1p interacting factor NIF3 [Endomicrobiia bacterium]MCL2506670.1 NGG1p interacting factor NIF3 [Endomicrobiia bacterium]